MTMATVSRLAGALLVETAGAYFLVGNTKRPCDFPACGFADPGAIDALARPFLALEPRGAIALEPPCLSLDLEGESLAVLFAERLLIERNASVSDRLWRLLLGQTDDAQVVGDRVDVRWFAHMPKYVWDVVRESVLRCL
jgi:hypothetical protein